MLLLVSTPLHIFMVDTASGKVSTIRTGDGYYYGITCNEEIIVLTHFIGYLQFYSQKSTILMNGMKKGESMLKLMILLLPIQILKLP